MNYFGKSNVLLWVIIVLLVIILSAIGTMFFNMHHRQGPDSGLKPEMFRDENFLKDKLDLNEEQIKQFKEINSMHDERRITMMEEMRNERHLIDSQLTGDNTDTAKLNSMINEMTKMQALMIKGHIKSYLELKKICNPEQQKKLAVLFREMMKERQAKGYFRKHDRPQ
jgi:Spy/CpxP family protein refolding chaperone